MSAVAQTVMDRGAELTEPNYQFLKEYLYRESGLVLDNGKNYLLESRLIPILKRQKLSALNELCVSLQRNPKEHPAPRSGGSDDHQRNDVFSRSRPLARIEATVLPELIEYRKDSASCAFGRPLRPRDKRRTVLPWRCLS